ncbi:MAG: hypothetical protein ACJ72N_09670 [Labedaea sp.]
MLPITADELITPPHDVVEDPSIALAQRARAVRAVAAAAVDAADCAALLAALGLRPEEARTPLPTPRSGN